MNKWEENINEEDFVLDIGCWDGKKVLNLSQKCKNVYGMDINTKRFSNSNEKIKNKLVFGDVTKQIPFRWKFNWIILSEVLEHLNEDSKAIENISKNLKDGGKLILSTPRSVKFFEFWDPAWVRWKFGGKERHHHYTKSELFGKLRNHGLEVKDYYIRGNSIWLLSRWINVFLRYGLRLNSQINCDMGKGSYDWVILAEKIK